MTGSQQWRIGRRGALSLGRAGGVAAIALAGLLGPGADVAQAGDEWCDVDPLLLIRTPAGNVVTVYYMTGVLGPLYLVGPLLSLLSVRYTVEPDSGGTKVTLSVTVPRGMLGLGLGPALPTRVKVTSGPLGSGTLYGSATGESGSPMIVPFRLPVP